MLFFASDHSVFYSSCPQKVRALKMLVCVGIGVFLSVGFAGCGTTKWSDTSRTGTEQLLISNAIDNAVGKIDFSPLKERRVFLESSAIGEVTDNKYLAMAVRQHLSASGGRLCDQRENAEFIVEVRAGAVGTDRDDSLLLGVPAITFPSITGIAASGATIPEIPIVKRTRQKGVVKLAIFVYDRESGTPILASGNKQSDSSARNLWFAGSGPLAYGTIYPKTTFAGHDVPSFVKRDDESYRSSFADHMIIFPQSIKESTSPESQPESQKTMMHAEIEKRPQIFPFPERPSSEQPFSEQPFSDRVNGGSAKMADIPAQYIYPGN
ncbi:MAG: DUF6655 family protein [Thermoguttaceae bacterium]